MQTARLRRLFFLLRPHDLVPLPVMADRTPEVVLLLAEAAHLDLGGACAQQPLVVVRDDQRVAKAAVLVGQALDFVPWDR